jgi:putative ABC transport system ATP-binding protein
MSHNSHPTIVKIKGLVKSYELGSTVVSALRGVDLEIRRGEFTALIGASGSGKTTLLNLIGCLDDAGEGTIEIDGVRLNELSENEKSALRNHKIGFIFQTFNLIPVLDVYENVEIPLVIRADLDEQEKRRRVEQALSDVGLADFAHHRPDQLSGGQRQRVAIARALVTEPALILADEPTANLDSKTANMIIDLLLELNRRKQVTFFFCSHDEKLINRVDRVVRILDGQVVA